MHADDIPLAILAYQLRRMPLQHGQRRSAVKSIQGFRSEHIGAVIIAAVLSVMYAPQQIIKAVSLYQARAFHGAQPAEGMALEKPRLAHLSKIRRFSMPQDLSIVVDQVINSVFHIHIRVPHTKII